MDLLSLNGPAATHPPSWYAATVEPEPERPALRGEVRADVVVVGGGYTGLSAALHLAEAGLRVVLLEAHRAGWGASGRNGGQLVTGQRLDQDELEASLGLDRARALFGLAEDAKALVHALCARHAIDCHWRPGYAYAVRSEGKAAALEGYVDHLRRAYAYDAVRFVAGGDLEAVVASPVFRAALVDDGAGHLHPLALAQGLARAAAASGATLHERSRALAIETGARGVEARTAEGVVRAEHLLLAGNAYMQGLVPGFEARLMPVNSFVATTEPLGAARAAALIASDACITDDRFVVNYFRRTHDHRLLFGGGETYGYRFPADVRPLVRAPLETTFPQLRGVRLDYAWGGTLAITRTRLPLLRRLDRRTLAAGGYSGQGVGLAVLAGKLLAEAVRGESEGFAAFEALRHGPFPGGAHLRWPLMALAMTWYGLRDRLGR